MTRVIAISMAIAMIMLNVCETEIANPLNIVMAIINV